MFRKLGLLIAALGLVLPVSAAEKPGSISGFVRNSGGVPQMGALVEVLGSAAHTLKVLTRTDFTLPLDCCPEITTSEFPLRHSCLQNANAWGCTPAPV